MVKPDEQTNEDEVDEEDPGTVTHITSDNPIISETIVNTAWEPIATQQVGEHISSYDGSSVDWMEKKAAIAYAVGMSEDALIYWKVKNGGSTSKSIGIVSSKDQSDKYQVFIEWLDGQGWKPVKVDVLTTLNFNY